jgi:ATP adenylyltransferase
MKKLWAPWRIKYIELSDHNKKDCIFCIQPATNNDKKNLIVYRGKHCFIVMNLFPYNNGHLLIAPYRHTSDLSDLSENERLELMDLLAVSKEVLIRSISPHGFNIGMNLGEIAGAGVKDHLHFHIVPRWKGDTNFMPLFSDTKVISEGLDQTWEKLKKGFLHDS